MGFSNGNSTRSETSRPEEQAKRLTSNAISKKYVTDLLKKKAGTAYVNNELTKKASHKNLTELYSRIIDLKAALAKFDLESLYKRVESLEVINSEKSNHRRRYTE